MPALELVQITSNRYPGCGGTRPNERNYSDTLRMAKRRAKDDLRLEEDKRGRESRGSKITAKTYNPSK